MLRGWHPIPNHNTRTVRACATGSAKCDSNYILVWDLGPEQSVLNLTQLAFEREATEEELYSL